MKAKSIGCVLFREEKGRRYYLLLQAKRINDKLGEHTFWDFPKGAPEKGETEIQTAARETEEETNLNADLIDGFKDSIRFFFRKDGVLINKEVIFYLGKTKTSRAKISSEHISYAWLSYEQSLARLTFKSSKFILEKAENFLNKSSPSKIKAVIFDWNGVITDSLHLDHEIFLEECKRKQLKVPQSASFYANMFDNNVFVCLKRIGFHVNEKEETLYRRLYLEGLHTTNPFQGIKPMLSKLQKEYKLAIITSNYGAAVRKFFRNHGIKEFSLILSSDVDRRKEIKIKILLDKFSINKSEVIFVGDTVSDIVACRNAGIRIIAVTWGYHSKSRLRKAKPDFIADRPQDVIKILKKLEGS